LGIPSGGRFLRRSIALRARHWGSRLRGLTPRKETGYGSQGCKPAIESNVPQSRFIRVVRNVPQSGTGRKLNKNFEIGQSIKHFVLAFLIAVIGYLLVYHAIEHRAHERDRGESRSQTRAGEPSILIISPLSDLRMRRSYSAGQHSILIPMYLRWNSANRARAV